MSSVRSYRRLKSKVPIDKEHDDVEHDGLLLTRIRLALGEVFAEFFGTFTMFGDGRSYFRPIISLLIMLEGRRPLLRHVF